MEKPPFSWHFLESRIQRARSYLAEGDRVGSCALAGAVLETSLRQIVELANVRPLTTPPCPRCGHQADGLTALGPMIEALANRRIITARVRALLHKCRNVRNVASHGHFGGLTLAECNMLLTGATVVVAWGKKNASSLAP